MKTKILYCAILLCSMYAIPSYSQILVGPVAGGQHTWVAFDDKSYKDVYKNSPVWGFHAGANITFRVQNRFFLNTSILYSTKGKEVRGKDDPLLKNSVRYRYIDIPILYTIDFKAKVGASRQFKYFFGIGPNISYWLGGKGKISSADLNEVGIEEQSYKIVFNKSIEEIGVDEMTVEEPNRIQLGVNIAAGAMFEPVPYQKVMVTLRYEFGHSFFSRAGDGMFSQTYYQDVMQARNHGIRLSFAYLIDLNVEERKKGKSTINKSRL